MYCVLVVIPIAKGLIGKKGSVQGFSLLFDSQAPSSSESQTLGGQSRTLNKLVVFQPWMKYQLPLSK